MLKRLDHNPETLVRTGAVQRAEVVFIMRPQEGHSTLSFLGRFRTRPLTDEIVAVAGSFHRRWYRTHGVDVTVEKGW